MLNKLRTRLQSEKGFTLIELLVVVLIIGILAAIALPAFLGQRAKGQDSAAKSDARNMVSQMESFYVEKGTYAGGPGTNPGLNVGSGEGQVEIDTTYAADENGYKVVAHSKSGNTFNITKDKTSGKLTQDCSTTGGTTKGGCNSGSW
jgi:type IV pilus assembly protein PilA